MKVALLRLSPSMVPEGLCELVVTRIFLGQPQRFTKLRMLGYRIDGDCPGRAFALALRPIFTYEPFSWRIIRIVGHSSVVDEAAVAGRL